MCDVICASLCSQLYSVLDVGLNDFIVEEYQCLMTGPAVMQGH